jgi:hypothetical protein
MMGLPSLVHHLNNFNFWRKMMEHEYDADRAVAVLHQALSVCRGLLLSARTGNATQGEFDRLLESTGGETLTALIGQDTYRHVMRLSEALQEDCDILLSIRDEPY